MHSVTSLERIDLYVEVTVEISHSKPSKSDLNFRSPRVANKFRNTPTRLVHLGLGNETIARPELARLPDVGHEGDAWNGENPILHSLLAHHVEAVLARRKPKRQPKEHAGCWDIPRRCSFEVPLCCGGEDVPPASVEVGSCGAVFEKPGMAPVAE